MYWDLWFEEREREIWRYRIERRNSPQAQLSRQEYFEARQDQMWMMEAAAEEWWEAFGGLSEQVFIDENGVWEEEGGQENWDIWLGDQETGEI